MVFVSSKPRISESKVVDATGRGWDHWFAVLDGAGGVSRGHQALAETLVLIHGMDGWWSQTVTIEYEIVRGARVPGQTSDGKFAASASRRVGVPLETLRKAWVVPNRADEWWTGAVVGEAAGERFELGPVRGDLRRVRADTGALFVSLDSGGQAEIGFSMTDSGKAQVLIQITKLGSAEESRHWKEDLKTLLDRFTEWVLSR